ncbi:MAG: glycosyltransferase [Gemmatimonadales bacterium]
MRSSCVVVVIAGGTVLDRCVEALLGSREGEAATELEIVVSAAKSASITPSIETTMGVRVVRSADESPIALAAAGISAARGDLIALTEDHCVPLDGWPASLFADLGRSGVAAAGGPIVSPVTPTSFDWAFHMVDFYRYTPPVAATPVDSLSVCNVAYTRSALERLKAEWQDGFHETRVHGMLREHAVLMMVPGAIVVCDRRVGRLDGLSERFRFGRLFASKRFHSTAVAPRLAFAAATPLLPFLLLARIARRSCASPRLAGLFARSSAYIVPLLVAWSAGELVGYVTSRPPRSSAAARNRLGPDEPIGALFKA